MRVMVLMICSFIIMFFLSLLALEHRSIEIPADGVVEKNYFSEKHKVILEKGEWSQEDIDYLKSIENYVVGESAKKMHSKVNDFSRVFNLKSLLLVIFIWFGSIVLLLYFGFFRKISEYMFFVLGALPVYFFNSSLGYAFIILLVLLILLFLVRLKISSE